MRISPRRRNAAARRRQEKSAKLQEGLLYVREYGCSISEAARHVGCPDRSLRAKAKATPKAKWDSVECLKTGAKDPLPAEIRLVVRVFPVTGHFPCCSARNMIYSNWRI